MLSLIGSSPSFSFFLLEQKNQRIQERLIAQPRTFVATMQTAFKIRNGWIINVLIEADYELQGIHAIILNEVRDFRQSER